MDFYQLTIYEDEEGNIYKIEKSDFKPKTTGCIICGKSVENDGGICIPCQKKEVIGAKKEILLDIWLKNLSNTG